MDLTPEMETLTFRRGLHNTRPVVKPAPEIGSCSPEKWTSRCTSCTFCERCRYIMVYQLHEETEQVLAVVSC